jgi:hypothetical protein
MLLRKKAANQMRRESFVFIFYYIKLLGLAIADAVKLSEKVGEKSV